MLGKTRVSTAPVTLGTAGAASAQPQSTWAHVGHRPLSDRATAAQVTHVPEVRRANAQANS
jgi:hypothetical protein